MTPICYIVGAYCKEDPVIQRSDSDFVIAADGGYAVLQKVGIKPDLVVGDFDSLGYLPNHPHVVRHPVEKDDTDLALAAKEGLARGFRRFVFFGGVGGRLDHTLANLALLHRLSLNGYQGFLYGEGAVLTAITNATLTFCAPKGNTLSVFAVGADAHGVSLQGVKYPLESASLTPSIALGVSNEFTDRAACVSVQDGSLLLYWHTTPKEFLSDLLQENYRFSTVKSYT
jgi:thiamine pyrophosphokinase